jgi:hypothetical protein
MEPFREITGLLATPRAGAAAWCPALAPNMLVLVGSTGARLTALAFAKAFCGIPIAALPTAREFVTTSRGTAVNPPGRFELA